MAETSRARELSMKMGDAFGGEGYTTLEVAGAVANVLAASIRSAGRNTRKHMPGGLVTYGWPSN